MATVSVYKEKLLLPSAN